MTKINLKKSKVKTKNLEQPSLLPLYTIVFILAATVILAIMTGCADHGYPVATQGVAGKDGANGQQGAKGDSGATGATGLSGPSGAVGAQGAVGQQGPQGSQGVQGQAGAQGASGTSVTPVQLCDDGFVATYPSVFPESALCIGERLYGVYSANGGFLAYLPPGTYVSNGINASCKFIIENGCKVLH